jgi:hypothetical protein
MSLVFSSSKFSFYLLLFLAVPVIVFSHEILDVWLVDIPDYTELFMVLVVIIGLIDAISNPLMTLAQATGKVKLYQAVVGSIIIMNLPLSWLFLHFGYPAEYTMYVAILVAITALVSRMFILKKIDDFPVGRFLNNVLLKLLLTSLCALSLTWIIKRYIFCDSSNLWNLLGCICLSVLVTILAIVFIGFNARERNAIKGIVMSKLRK